MYSHGLWDGLSTTTRVGMEWTRDKTLELLREYQQRRVLWDWNARGYRDRAKRKRAIQELAEILCCNTLEVEKKITNLKCQYSREVHKIQNSRDAATGPDDVYVSKWFAFKAMQFLQFGTRRYSKRKKVGGRKTHRARYSSLFFEWFLVEDLLSDTMTDKKRKKKKKRNTRGVVGTLIHRLLCEILLHKSSVYVYIHTPCLFRWYISQYTKERRENLVDVQFAILFVTTTDVGFPDFFTILLFGFLPKHV